MKITRERIQLFLDEVKPLIKEGKYIVDNRDKNEDLLFEYILPDEERTRILLSLEVDDFSEIVRYKNKNGEYVPHYVFGKEETLTQRFGSRDVRVSLYIKINKIDNVFVVVVSFHEEEYPITYYFR